MKAKTRLLTLLLAVLLLTCSLLPTTVYADESATITKSNAINSNYYYWGGQMISYTFTYYDGTTITTNHGGFALHYVGANLTSIVGAQVAYCIEPDTGSTTGTTYTGTSAENSAYWNNKLSPQQREAIKLILLYGAPNNLKSTDANTLFGYEGATQMLIWEIVMGLRSPIAPYTLNDSRLKNNFYNNSAFPSTKTGYDTIVSKMQSHLDIPSFASYYQNSAPTYTLNYDGTSGLYKTSLTDTKGVLSQDYTFSASGVTFSKSGNTLNISAPASAFANGNVTASATGRSLDVTSMTQMIWSLPGKQTVTTFSASPDPVHCYFKLKVDGGTATIRKTSDTDDVSGYCFKIYKHTANTSWYGKSDSSGNVYVTDSNYSASGTKVYSFTGLTDGTYTFLEALSKKGKDLVFPDSWRITVTRGGTTQFDHTYTASDLSRDSNGDCRLASVAITGLTGGGTMTMTIHNAPETGDLEVVKTSEDGKVNGISFKVEQYEPGVGWWTKGTYKTNASGKFSITGLTVGTQLRITEIVPEGYECTSDNPQTVTIVRGTNTVTFTNKPFAKLEIVKTCSDGNISGISFKVEQYEPTGGIGWWTKGTYTTDANGKFTIDGLQVGTQLRVTEIVPDGYVCNSTNPQTVTLVAGTNTLNFENEPLASLEIVKTCSDGKIDNISFKVEQYEPTGGIGWWTQGTYTTDASGKITMDGLKVGAKLRVTEIVPDGYVCNSTNPQTVTLVAGTNTLNFENEPLATLEIVKTSTDGNVSGISFEVEQYEPTGGIGWWTKGTYTTDASGKITIDGLRVGTQLRVTEIVPEGYVCDSENPQTITLVAGTNTLSFENEPLASLEIIKTSTDGQVSGITFTVERYVGRRWRVYGTYETNSEGKIEIPDLRVGFQMRITETVPENYICLSDNPQTLTLVAGTNTVSFENKPIVRLELLKTSEDGNVDGIEFTLSIMRGRRFVDVGTYTTHDGGQITVEDLTLGATYRLTETVPTGYVGITPTQDFVAVIGTNTVNFENRLIRGSLRIVKVDKATKTPLEGAGFMLYTSGGRAITDGYTDANGELTFADLPYGDYYYQEFLAPAGFTLDEAQYPFSITEDGVEIVHQRENQPKEGSITIYKTNEDGRQLPGVEFLLEYSVDGGTTWQPIQFRGVGSDVQAGFTTSPHLSNGKLTTGRNGTVTFSGLCIDTQLGVVLYRITETKTADGYSLLPGYAFEGSLSENSEIEISFTVVNQPVFKMPATGDSGVWHYSAFGILMMVACVAALVLSRKRKQEG